MGWYLGDDALLHMLELPGALHQCHRWVTARQLFGPMLTCEFRVGP
jgi:hypothetical protein